MAAFTVLWHLITNFTFIFMLLKSICADSNRDLLNFVSNVALFGDAEFINGSFSSSSLVKLTGSERFSAGLVLYKKPIKIIEGKPRKLVSFSTYFSFSMSPKNGNGFAFVVVPIGFPLKVFGNSSFGLPLGMEKSDMRVFAVEFDTHMDKKYGDLNENHVAIDVGNLVSVKVSNVSSKDLVLNSGNKLNCWIDYEANSRLLEVRLSKFYDRRPIDPLLTYPIDFSKVLNVDDVFVGLSSSNGNTSQTCKVHSWSLNVLHYPTSFHSLPLDPHFFADKIKPLVVVHKRRSCVLRVIVALIVGTGCGALGAILVLFVWTRFGSRRPVVPDELTAVHPVEYEYKKMEVVSDEAKKDNDGKK